MSFEAKLERYAELLIARGVNLQEGQVLVLTAEAYHRDFATMITDLAYQRGAKHVDLNLTDARAVRSRILHSSLENLTTAYHPKGMLLMSALY